MKLGALLLVGLGLIPALAFASDSWQCGGGDIEGAGISVSRGQLVGDVSWDCFPGGGICTQRSVVRKVAGENGETIYVGRYFKLVIDTASAGENGEFRARIAARDMTDPSDEGRGLTLSEEVTCKSE